MSRRNTNGRSRCSEGGGFGRGFEAGCSIGVLTRRLAERCDTLLAVDIVEAPLETARTACADQPGVRFACMDIATNWPGGQFDLIVLSEVLYFLSPEAIARVAGWVTEKFCVRRDGGAGQLAWTRG